MTGYNWPNAHDVAASLMAKSRMDKVSAKLETIEDPRLRQFITDVVKAHSLLVAYATEADRDPLDVMNEVAMATSTMAIDTAVAASQSAETVIKYINAHTVAYYEYINAWVQANATPAPAGQPQPIN